MLSSRYSLSVFSCVLLGIVFVLAFANASTADGPSWIFRRSQYSHDPATGARVAQYSPIPAVEPLADPRAITSVYRRSRSELRGADGSADSYYQVQSYGNGRGGLDAEWERFHDAWKESYTSGGYYRSGGYRAGGYGYGQPGRGGYGTPGYGSPNYGGGYGYGTPGFGYPNYGRR